MVFEIGNRKKTNKRKKEKNNNTLKSAPPPEPPFWDLNFYKSKTFAFLLASQDELQFQTVFRPVLLHFLEGFWKAKNEVKRRRVCLFLSFGPSKMRRDFWSILGGPGPCFRRLLEVKKRLWPKTTNFWGHFCGVLRYPRKRSKMEVERNRRKSRFYCGSGSCRGGSC